MYCSREYFKTSRFIQQYEKSTLNAQNMSVCVSDNDDSNNDLLELPIDNDTLFQLQQKDMFCNNILAQIDKGNIKEGQLYTIKDKLLKRYVVDSDNTYETNVV